MSRRASGEATCTMFRRVARVRSDGARSLGDYRRRDDRDHTRGANPPDRSEKDAARLLVGHLRGCRRRRAVRPQSHSVPAALDRNFRRSPGRARRSGRARPCGTGGNVPIWHSLPHAECGDRMRDPVPDQEAKRPRRRRLSDHVMVAFHIACDEGDLEVARLLLTIAEFISRRPPHDRRPERRADRADVLVAAHERLWSLRHPEARDG